MPLIYLQHSSNLLERDKVTGVLPHIHQLLTEQLPAKLLACKSRVQECSSIYLGDGMSPNAFIHIELKVKKGRDAELLVQVGNNIIALLKRYFAASLDTLKLDISLEIIEISDYYFKHSKYNS